MPARRPSLSTIFAAIIISAAILLTAYKGSPDWLAMLLLLAVLIPGWKRPVIRWLNKGDPPEKRP